MVLGYLSSLVDGIGQIYLLHTLNNRQDTLQNIMRMIESTYGMFVKALVAMFVVYLLYRVTGWFFDYQQRRLNHQGQGQGHLKTYQRGRRGGEGGSTQIHYHDNRKVYMNYASTVEHKTVNPSYLAGPTSPSLRQAITGRNIHGQERGLNDTMLVKHAKSQVLKEACPSNGHHPWGVATRQNHPALPGPGDMRQDRSVVPWRRRHNQSGLPGDKRHNQSGLPGDKRHNQSGFPPGDKRHNQSGLPGDKRHNQSGFPPGDKRHNQSGLPGDKRHSQSGFPPGDKRHNQSGLPGDKRHNQSGFPPGDRRQNQPALPGPCGMRQDRSVVPWSRRQNQSAIPGVSFDTKN